MSNHIQNSAETIEKAEEQSEEELKKVKYALKARERYNQNREERLEYQKNYEKAKRIEKNNGVPRTVGRPRIHPKPEPKPPKEPKPEPEITEKRGRGRPRKYI